MLEEAVLNALFCRCCVKKKDKLLLGFSGGPDSVSLLDILTKSEVDVAIAYYDHQLRPESRQEWNFSRQIGDRYQIPVFNGSSDIKAIASMDRQGIEFTARKYRYRFLADIAHDIGAAAIVVAHHADDQVETILLHLIRGTGLSGLLGMPYRIDHEYTKTIPVVRPMLNIWKSEILRYCKENNLEYCTDTTNFGSEFTRNKLRNETIPNLMMINPQVKENILRMRAILQDEEDFLIESTRSVCDDVIKRSEQGLVEVDIKAYKKLPINLQRRVLRAVLSAYFSMIKDIRYQWIEDIRHILTGVTRSKSVQINDKIQILVEHKSGFILRDVDQISSTEEIYLDDDLKQIELRIPEKTRINSRWMLKIEKMDRYNGKSNSAKNNTDPLVAYLDTERIIKPITMRRKRPGDRFVPMGMNGHSMKVSDFWINKKVPERLRKDYPIICDARQILWIPGFQPSENSRITESTQSVIKISVVKNRKLSFSS